jgi:hypothetical protein
MKRFLFVAAALVAFVAPSAVEAQAGFYPAMQPTRVVSREYNFALADFEGGSALVFQWREGLNSPRSQFTADIALADIGTESGLTLGGTFNYQLMRETTDVPFDMVFGAGLGVTLINDVNFFRIPIGVAIGHRFPLEGQFFITPFVHPRISIDRVSANGASDSETNIDMDIGASFEFNPRMAVRLVAGFGDVNDGVAISFAYSPRGMR